MTELRTRRLILRPWRDTDLAPFAALNADPEVRRFFPGTLDRAQSDASVARHRAHFDRYGFGFWAIEAVGIAPFIGFAGLLHVAFEAPFTPAVETGWRLASAHWGNGYATEAAQAAQDHGFGPLNLAEIVAFAVPGNIASRRVMEHVGMTHDPDGDFDHPAVPVGSPVRRQVLYRAKPPRA